MAHKAGHFKALFQRVDQPPVFNLNVRHIADHAAFRVDQTGQNHRDGDEFADLALTAFNKLRDGIQQRMLQRLLGAFRKGIVLFRNGFTAQIVQRERGVMTAQTDANCLKIAGFGNNGDSAAAPGGGLLINFFDQPAFDKLTRNFGYAGGGKLTLLGNLNPRDWPVLVNQAINCRAVKLFYEINITYLSLSAWCHTFSY
jgi:hypothetical protein